MERTPEAIDPPVMNAACSVAKTLEDVEALCATHAGAVVVGSVTVEPREGNNEPRWYSDEICALNSFGMPNGGEEYYRENLPDMVARAHEADKLFGLNIAGFDKSEYVKLAQMADETGVDFVEVNFGCPNVSEDGHQKPIVSFDLETMHSITKGVSQVTDKPIRLKLSPYSNPAELNQTAEMIGDLPVGGVVTSNTFPNGLMMENGEPVLNAGQGGVSGSALLQIALGQVQQFRQRLPESQAVIGVGGIESAREARLHFQAGASAVQLATLLVREGHHAMDGVARNLE